MSTATLADLRAMIRRDPCWADTTALPTATLDTVLVEGALDLALRGRALPKFASWNAVANTSLYVLGGTSPKVSNYLDLYWEAGALTYTDASVVLTTQPTGFQIVSEAWLDLECPSWRSDAASDTLQHAYLTYDGNGNLCLGVHPASATATPSFKLWYLSRGADMVTAADYPWTGNTTLLTHLEPFMKGIAWYALWQLHLQKSGLVAMEQKWMSLYLALADEMKTAQNRIFDAKLQGLVGAGRVTAGQTFYGKS